jgi:enterochelin esterase-like enzyme
MGILGLLCLLLAADAPAPIPVSPRIEKLRTDISSDTTAEARFWKEIERRGTPLVEPSATRRHVLVTFLWKGGPDTRTVVVHGDGTRGNPADHQLSRIPGTSVWSRTYLFPSDMRFGYSLSPNDDLRPMESVPPAEFAKRMATFAGDPLNRDKSSGGPVPMASLSLPDAPKQPYLELPAGAAEPAVEHRTFRDLQLHLYRPGGVIGPLPLLLLFDGSSYATEMRAPVTVENLVRLGRIRPVMLVMIENAPGKRNSDLTCNEAFTEAIANGLLPWIRSNYAVSGEPPAIGGYSYGGLAAAFAALRHPSVFGAVLSQSGSYWWKPRDATAWEWLAEQVRAAPPSRTRFYMEVGLTEIGTPGGRPSMLESNRRLRDLLRARGHEVTYSEFNGDHSVLNWRGSFADGLVALFGPSGRLP